MKITNLVSIKKYRAGHDGNLLVSLDENLETKLGLHVGDKSEGVHMLICTAYVSDKNEQEILKKHCDDATPYDRVIVVNSKFLKLFNKTQLILLERQNAKEDFESDPSCDMDPIIHAEIATFTKYGTWRSTMAFDKERKMREKDEVAIGKARHKENKASARKCKRAMRNGKGKLSNAFHKVKVPSVKSKTPVAEG
jgi:hypothetical protein